MRGAIIGFGFIAEGHLAAYNTINDLDIVAIVDVNQERLNKAKRMIAGVHCYDSLNAMKLAEQLDFIDVCTPPYCRYRYMKKGLESGWHVIGEKPFLLEKEQYLSLYEIAIKNHLVLYPSHNYKFAPIMQIAKEITKQDCFGNIIGGQFKTLRIGHAKGCKEWKTDWRRQREYSGGGIIEDHGPHSIYMACSLIGKWPIAVSCICGKLKDDDFDTEDTAWITLYFDDDVKIDINLTWASSVRDTYYYLYGSKESIYIENDTIRHFTATGELDKKCIFSEFNDPSHKTWFVDVLVDFCNSVTLGSCPLDLLKESYVTIATIESAYCSANLGGKKVKISTF